MDDPVLLVRDLMTVGVETTRPDTPVERLAFILLEKNIEEVVVLDEGTAVGVVGRDELALVFRHENYRSLTAEDVMRPDVPTIPPDVPIATAAQVMKDLGVRTLFLMHNAGGLEYPAAMISYYHLLRKLVSRSAEDLQDLGIKARRQSPLETFLERRDAARKNNLGR